MSLRNDVSGGGILDSTVHDDSWIRSTYENLGILQ